jgi:fumarate hydratase subunit alpha
MKTINAQEITKTVRDLCLKANFCLRKDIVRGLKQALAIETNKRAKHILEAILENARIAEKEKLAICQDTGLVCVFVELGQDVRIKGDFKAAINQGIKEAYQKGALRNSIVPDPLLRGKPKSVPGLVHIDLVKGDKLKLTVTPKGFGCENKSQLKMFNPTVGWDKVKGFILDAVKTAGPDACPPYVVGVGIGGTADQACLLAKKALLPDIPGARLKTGDRSSKLEKQLLEGINKSGLGPMGLGGKTTALAVNIETFPTHIAGMPVAVNISCHATRKAAATL